MAEWTLRRASSELGQRYRDAGWWDDGTLGSMVEDGIRGVVLMFWLLSSAVPIVKMPPPRFR